MDTLKNEYCIFINHNNNPINSPQLNQKTQKLIKLITKINFFFLKTIEFNSNIINSTGYKQKLRRRRNMFSYCTTGKFYQKYRTVLNSIIKRFQGKVISLNVENFKGRNIGCQAHSSEFCACISLLISELGTC